MSLNWVDETKIICLSIPIRDINFDHIIVCTVSHFMLCPRFTCKALGWQITISVLSPIVIKCSLRSITNVCYIRCLIIPILSTLIHWWNILNDLCIRRHLRTFLINCQRWRNSLRTRDQDRHLDSAFIASTSRIVFIWYGVINSDATIQSAPISFTSFKLVIILAFSTLCTQIISIAIIIMITVVFAFPFI